MITFKAAISALALMCAATPAFAASATPEGARALAATFESYLGKAVAGPGGIMRVTTNGTGDGYDVSVDFGPVIAQIPADSGIKVGPMLINFTLLPQDNGTWRFRQVGAPRISVTLPMLEYDVDYTGFEADGIFDPKLVAFSSWSSKTGAVTVRTTGPTAKADVKGGPMAVTGTSRPAASGKGVDGTVVQTLGAFSETFTVPSDGKDIPLGISLRSARMEGSFAGVTTREILDLWAFAMAHATPENVKPPEAELKAKLLATFPVLNNLEFGISMENLVIDTPLGRFGAAKALVSEAFTGVVSNGSFSLGMKMSDFEMPKTLVPAWAVGLVPKDSDITIRYGGFDVERLAREAIIRMDLSKTPPLDLSEEEMGRLVLPSGDFTVDLPKGSAVAPLYSINWEGSMSMNIRTNFGTGKARIVAKGLDEVIAALTASKSPDAMNVVTGLYAARAFGKLGAPGEYSWEIEGSTAGDVTINGNRLPFGK